MKNLSAFYSTTKGYTTKTINRLKAIILLLLVYALLVVITKPFEIHAQPNFPELTGHVVDSAHLLNKTTLQSLIITLSDYETKTGDQIVIATVPSLSNHSIESYSNALFRHWGIGQKKINNGVFFLIAPNERSLRIEVGYGLEGVLTDATVSTLINSLILPEFQQGNYQQGIIVGTQAIIEVLQGDQSGLLNRIKTKEKIEQQKQEDAKTLNIIIQAVIFLILFIIFGLPLLASIFGIQVGPKKYKWLGIVFILWFQGFFTGGGGFGSGRPGRGFGSNSGIKSGHKSFKSGGGSSGGGGASGSW